MKRFLIILIALLSLTSCFKEGANVKRKYTLEATFQYPGISFGTDSTFVNTQDVKGFGYDALNFFHQLDDSKRFQGGFILSCAEMPKSGKTAGLMNTYRANVPATVGNIYTVFYQNPASAAMPEHDVEFAYDENGTCEMLGCYVTNTVEVADFVKLNFKKGDRLSIKATGYLKGAVTAEAEIVLAEFTEKKDSIVSIWTPFELGKLGSVDFVDFEIVSSNPNVPSYFCMDAMVANIDIEY